MKSLIDPSVQLLLDEFRASRAGEISKRRSIRRCIPGPSLQLSCKAFRITACSSMTISLIVFLSLLAFYGAPGAQEPSITRELHWAVTGEKFELALERLRAGKKNRHPWPVVLSHGLFVNSLFLNMEGGPSLAQSLAKDGFDVWNLSLRGTGRSLNPLRDGPHSWNLDDMIDKDVPAVIGYIQKTAGARKIDWVGYELGGLLLYGFLEKKGSSAIAAAVTLAAPASFDDPEQAPMQSLLKLDGNPALKKFFLYLNAPALGRLLIPMVPKIGGLFYNRDNMEEETLQKLLGEGLAKINPGVFDQLLLMIKRKEFVAAQGNFSYRKHLSDIRLPLLLIGGESDALAPPAAIRAVYRAAGSKDRALRIFGPRSKDSSAYGHLDLILGKRSAQEVFPAIAKWLGQRDR